MVTGRVTPRLNVPGRFADMAALRRWLEASRNSATWTKWTWQVRNALDAVDLARLGLLEQQDAAQVAIRYPARVTPYYLAASNLADPTDPLYAQWLPHAGELAPLDGDSTDPFNEVSRAPLPGIVHRFPDRVLVLTSTQCAVNCRHCTRKNERDGRAVVKQTAELRDVVAYVTARPEVREVILSGGDPLLDSDAALVRRVRAFATLPQIDAVRIGTRTPVTLPMRITDALADQLGAFKKVWINTQFNHAAELTPKAIAACARLVDAGIPVSNQTVLLKGINDSVDALTHLCCGLQRNRIRPYYVFIGDRVTGTAHFRVTASRATELANALARRVGGLALPRFVADIPDLPAKTAVQELVG